MLIRSHIHARTHTPSNSPPTGYVEWVGVRPSYQRREIGTALMRTHARACTRTHAHSTHIRTHTIPTTRRMFLFLTSLPPSPSDAPLTHAHTHTHTHSNSPPTGYVEWVGVRPSYQRRGIGTALVTEAIRRMCIEEEGEVAQVCA